MVLINVFGYLGGMVALPITLCAAPLTLVADLIIGLAECIFCLYHNVSKEDLFILAHRKFVVSPCQHLAFCLGCIGGMITLPLIYSTIMLLIGRRFEVFVSGLAAAPLFWTFGYSFGQVAVGKLPGSLNHRSFNIFLDGGSGEKPGEKWFDADFTKDSTPQFQKRDEKQSNFAPDPGTTSFSSRYNRLKWREFLKGEILYLSHINDANLHPDYIGFKIRVMKRCFPEDLLQLSRPYSPDEMRKQFRKFSLVLHPDKNAPRQREATALFKILNEANHLLSPE